MQMAGWESSQAPRGQVWGGETWRQAGDAAEVVPARQRRHTVSGPDRVPPGAGGGQRTRRLSAGEQPEGGEEREWVTTRPTTWRAAPRADSGKISDLPLGRCFKEVPSVRRFEGWLPVAPRGFVPLADLELVEAAPPPAAAVASDTSAPPSASPWPASSAAAAPAKPASAPAPAPAGAELDSQDSEQVLAARRELEALQEARKALAGEVEMLQACREKEHRRLKECREQRDRMQEKLRVCSDAVVRTVNSIDRLHCLEEQKMRGPSEELRNAEADALAAGLAAEHALSSITQENSPAKEGQENKAPCPTGSPGPAGPGPSDDMEKENDPPVGAHRKGLGEEWDGVKACGKRVLVALPEDVPVDDFDEEGHAPLQQIQLE